MVVTERVKDSNSKTVGFLMNDGSFFNDYYIKKNIESIENLTLLRTGVFRCDVELAVVPYKRITKTNYKKIVRQNPFVRDVQEQLLNWKRENMHKVLQLEGSRQIGKTTELQKFAYNNYEYVINVNLASDLFDFSNIMLSNGVNTLSMDMYCKSANLPPYVNNKKTILIIDEVQVSSKIYNLIRSFNSNLNCDLIVTGSYLGQTLKKEYFQPAGTISYLRMFPLSYREFCKAFKAELELDNIDLFGSGDVDKYNHLYSLYDLYIKIGGYPEVLKTYLKKKDLSYCYDVIEGLLDTFEKESRNYFQDSKETMIFNTVYTQAVREMCVEKRGTGSKSVDIVTSLVKESQKMLVSRDEVSRAIQWLIYSGIIGECGMCNNGDINEIFPARRLYYMDCGIANYIANQTGLLKRDVDGFITENFVYSELYRLYATIASKKKVKGKVPCFSILNDFELDFLVLGTDNTIYGIEAKTDTGDTKSLKVFIEKKLVDKGIVVKRTKGGHGEKFDTIPIFSVGARFPYN